MCRRAKKWSIVPWGFRKVLVYCWDHFAKALDIPIIVYENGYAMENESSMAIESIIDDTARQEYYTATNRIRLGSQTG